MTWGDCAVKHGERVNVVNLYSGELGNPELPEKFRRGRRWKILPSGLSQGSDRRAVTGRWALIVAAVMMLGGVAVGIPFFLHRLAIKSASASISKSSPVPASAIPEKSIAVLPFENRSDDKQNTYFADGLQNEMTLSSKKPPKTPIDMPILDGSMRLWDEETTRRGTTLS